jgi:predicted nucleic acid-binding protein
VATSGVLVDAGPLVAILSKRDQHHHVCVAAARRIRGPFYTSWPIVTEAAHLLKSRAEKVEKLLSRIREAKIRVLQLDAADVDGISSILMRYADQDFDFADASLMHLIEREGMETIFTVDHRHFSVFRTTKGQSLVLVPSQL